MSSSLALAREWAAPPPSPLPVRAIACLPPPGERARCWSYSGDVGIEPITLDLDDAESIRAAVATIEQATDGYGLDVLVNNAGFATAGALAELPDQALRAQFETNVFGLMSLTRAVLPKMIERRAGRIVNVSSVSGPHPRTDPRRLSRE